MNLLERRAKERLDCYTINELYDFFSQFYVIRKERDTYIITKEKFYLQDSDISIEIKAYGDIIYSNEILICTWANGFGYNQKALHLEYTDMPSYKNKTERIYEWYIVDRSITSYTRIDKSDILPMLVDFIMENDDDRYAKPIPLKRSLVIDSLMKNKTNNEKIYRENKRISRF